METEASLMLFILIFIHPFNGIRRIYGTLDRFCMLRNVIVYGFL
jgi:hypothetical protein